jgi:hypothetical protein
MVLLAVGFGMKSYEVLVVLIGSYWLFCANPGVASGCVLPASGRQRQYGQGVPSAPLPLPSPSAHHRHLPSALCHSTPLPSALCHPSASALYFCPLPSALCPLPFCPLPSSALLPLCPLPLPSALCPPSSASALCPLPSPLPSCLPSRSVSGEYFTTRLPNPVRHVSTLENRLGLLNLT